MSTAKNMSTAKKIAANRRNGQKGGRPKGTKNPATLTKEAIRARVQERVAAELDPLLDAQIANASGIKYLVARDPKSGKFERIAAGQVDGESIIEVWEKDPSVQAFTDLLNRAADKPAEQVQEFKVTGELNIVSRLHAARKRLAGRKDKHAE